MRTAKLILVGATLLLITGCKHPGPIDNTEISSPVKLYVANSGDGTISVIDVSENEVTKTIPVGLKPAAIAVSTERKRAYVANFMSKSVSVIDTETDAVRNTISLPGHPVHLVAGDSMVYVIVDHDTTIFNDAYIGGIRLSEDVFVDSLYRDSRCNSMQHLAYSSTGFLYGASLISLTCDPAPPFWPLIINTNTGELISNNAFSSRILKLSHDQQVLHIVGDFLHVREENLYAFDLEMREIDKEIALKNRLSALAISPSGQMAYTANVVENTVYVFDLDKYAIADSILVNSLVSEILVSKDNQFIYTTHPTANQISVINITTKQVEKYIAVGLTPKAMALIPPTI